MNPSGGFAMISPNRLALVCLLQVACLGIAVAAPATPGGLVSRSGDRSVVLHWDHNAETNLAGYHVYRATTRDGPFVKQTAKALVPQSHVDFAVTNDQAYYYQVTAATATEESAPSPPLEVSPRPFANDEEFLEYAQQTSFDYFWYAANPRNGMVPDRSTPTSPCSIAAVGFGLTTIGIGINHGWITRAQGRERVLTTLKTFWETPQGIDRTGTIGYKGWFYHFLNMNTATRYTPFSNVEVSSVDTAWLLAGALYAKQYFNGAGRRGERHPRPHRLDLRPDRLDLDGPDRQRTEHGLDPRVGFYQQRDMDRL